ncbi:MAG: saccharopine dehydrogenase NADP-binding domain-containing protein [Deltaproteobacteria bacterium]|nr:saccharopine dehydrogenase NADP-binding domain-containing protein [Deltaproteobacteria bacterium]
MEHEREFDLVLLGATGFTGQLVARYLATATTARPLRWAIAGRSRAKLASVHQQLEGVGVSPEIIEANTDNAQELESMASRTRVVLTTVGPYAKYGAGVVGACVAQRTHYADITGEPAFVQQMLTQYDGPAREAGVRIVHCCGFDSVPHDLGVHWLAQLLAPLRFFEVEGFVRANGKLSGGTWQSALNAMSELRHSKSSGGSTRRPQPQGRTIRALASKPGYRKSLRAWVLPMPTIDPWIVLQSARTLSSYGPDVRYAHYIALKRLPQVIGLVGGVAAVAAFAQAEVTKNWLASKIPSGDGPDQATRDRSWFECRYEGRTEARSGYVLVKGGDPGYSETAKMVAESALCLAFDQADLPPFAGVLTPAVAMGDALRARLERAGMTFEAHVK